MNVTSAEVRCRRQTVTVLFVDIVGFTSLVEELDCTDVHALQRDYFDVVSAVLRTKGGVVEKYIGDAVMAVFGATCPQAGSPEAVSRAAGAAVRAGLRIQEALRGRLLGGGWAIRSRVGIATGDAIVDLDATRDGGYGMVHGSIVATASRLQSYAPHDTVVVCSGTQAVSDGAVAYHELPPVSVPGKRVPVALWRALEPGREPVTALTLQAYA